MGVIEDVRIVDWPAIPSIHVDGLNGGNLADRCGLLATYKVAGLWH